MVKKILILILVITIFIFSLQFSNKVYFSKAEEFTEEDCLNLLSYYDSSVKSMTFQSFSTENINYKVNQSERIEPYLNKFNKSVGIYYLKDRFLGCVYETFQFSDEWLLDAEIYDCGNSKVFFIAEDKGIANFLLFLSKTNETIENSSIYIGFFAKWLKLDEFYNSVFNTVKECRRER